MESYFCTAAKAITHIIGAGVGASLDGVQSIIQAGVMGWRIWNIKWQTSFGWKIFVGISVLSLLAFQCTMRKSASVMQPFYQQNLSIKYTSRKCWKNKNSSLEISEEFVRSNRVLQLPCQTWSWESEFLHLSPKHCDTCLLLLIQQPFYIKYLAVFRIFFFLAEVTLEEAQKPPHWNQEVLQGRFRCSG